MKKNTANLTNYFAFKERKDSYTTSLTTIPLLSKLFIKQSVRNSPPIGEKDTACYYKIKITGERGETKRSIISLEKEHWDKTLISNQSSA